MLLNNTKFSIGLLITGLYVFSFNNSIAAAINGTWQSEGYSMIQDISDSTVKRYELSKVSCILVETISISKFNQEYAPIVFSDNGQEMTTHLKFSENKYEYQRINQLPQQCQNGGTQANTNPILNFDILWHTFNENYAFFDVRGVDWDAQYAIYRPQVNGTTSEIELFNILKTMLAPLQDGHVNLLSQDGSMEFSGMELRMMDHFQRIMDEYLILNPDMTLWTYYLEQIKQFNTIISKQYLAGNSKSDPSKFVSWGKIQNRIGYLSIKQMDGFSGSNDPMLDLQAISHTMDRVMTDLQDTDAIVIDVRLNGGGFDEAAYKIVSRFTAEVRSALIKKAVSQQGFSDNIIIKMKPESQSTFTKPVFVLFSGRTASAAEAFLLGMKVLPNVTLIGEHSMGILSDMLNRRLANGMQFSLSNEVYTDMHGIVYEKIGIQPDIAVNFLLKSDRDAGIDSAIEAAILLTP